MPPGRQITHPQEVKISQHRGFWRKFFFSARIDFGKGESIHAALVYFVLLDV